MCGIAGLLSNRYPADERERLVHRMLGRLAHRGPSGVAVWSGDEITLGIARLAIVAPRTVPRVLGEPGHPVHAVVNGEVYNHGALRTELRGRGHRVPEHPDTAVIPALYQDCGRDFSERLDGMFAAAVWHERERRLVLARDRAGEKPLFLHARAGLVAFASEPGALHVLPGVSRDPDPGALSRYLVHGFFADEECAFAAIRQIAPATVVEIEAGTVRRRRYWRPWDAARHTPDLDPEDAPLAVRGALERAVAARVPGDVPFGVFLSGGVDSSLIATLAARVAGHRFPTFCLRLPDRGYDESGYARQVASSIGSDHHELVMDPGAGEEALVLFARDMDQPLGDPSVLPTWALARLASHHVPVVLSGEGGDELFAGYPTYLGHRHARLARMLPAKMRDALLAVIRNLRPRHHHVTIGHMLERFLRAGAATPFERHVGWFGTASPAESTALLAPALRGHAGPGGPLGWVHRVESDLQRAGFEGLHEHPAMLAYQLLDFELYLSGDLLTKIDRCSMAHGLESRAPFLQHELIELAFGLPESARLRGMTTKWALKRAARDLLPKDVLVRRKQGFSPPFSSWARGPLRPLVTERLSRSRVERAGVLDPDATNALLAGHLAGATDRGRTLWALLSLQMWAERWLVDRVETEERTPLESETATADRP